MKNPDIDQDRLDFLDKMRTFKEASEILNIKYYKIQRAARDKIVPTYSLYNGRKYVKVRDILGILSQSA